METQKSLKTIQFSWIIGSLYSLVFSEVLRSLNSPKLPKIKRDDYTYFNNDICFSSNQMYYEKLLALYFNGNF